MHPRGEFRLGDRPGQPLSINLYQPRRLRKGQKWEAAGGVGARYEKRELTVHGGEDPG